MLGSGNHPLPIIRTRTGGPGGAAASLTGVWPASSLRVEPGVLNANHRKARPWRGSHASASSRGGGLCDPGLKQAMAPAEGSQEPSLISFKICHP